MEWYANIGNNLIDNISVEIGGGTGWWCQKCSKFYRNKPKEGVVCQNIYKMSQLNNDKLKNMIHDLGGDISDEIVEQFIKNPTPMCKEIESIFRDENSFQTIEEAQYGTKYNNLMELILDRYCSDVYEIISVVCDSQTFAHEKRSGTIIDSYTSEMLDINTKISTQKINDIYVPQKFYFSNNHK